MMKLPNIACTLLMAAIPLFSSAADNKEEISGMELREWAEQQAKILPPVVDGVKMMRPIIEEDKATVSEITDIPGVDKQHIFIAALTYAIEHLDRSEKSIDKIDAVDYDAMRFVITRREEYDDGKKASAFKGTTAFQCADDMLSFATYDIDATYKEKGILPRTRPLEKLNPMKNERHKELFEDFSFTNSRYIHNLCEYIKSNPSLEVSHWKEIKNQEVTKGMNETEVKLAVGLPSTARDTSGKTKWMYGNDFVVIFIDGKVSTVIN